MSAYIEPLKTAIYIFPFLALLISFPFFIIEYRKFGRFLFFRGVVLYSFVFYLLCAYFLVILPLPSKEAVAQLTTPRYELFLGNSFLSFIRETVFRPFDIHTYLPAMKQMVFLEPVFNMLLFFPFGVYLRYYFRFSFKKVVLYSFLLSLFFELTQLSGLYFIYPRPYRLFDVNDLFHNTLGGCIGYLAAPLLMIIFPSKEQLDKRSVLLGQEVTYVRRLLAVIIDWTILNIIKQLIIGVLVVARLSSITYLVETYWYYALVVFLYFICYAYLTNGQTIGKKIVKIQVVEKEKKRIRFRTLFKRYGLLYLFYGALGKIVLLLNGEVITSTHLILISLLMIIGLCLLLELAFALSILWGIIRKDRQLFYEKWTHTHEISTLSKQK